MRRLWLAWALAGCGGAQEHTPEIDALARGGDLDNAVAQYAEVLENAPQRGITKTEFDEITARYCDAARRLGERVADEAAAPAERQARLIDVRGKVARCPAHLQLVARLGDELEEAGTAGWDAEVTPRSQAGQLAAAWRAAAKWVAGLEAERALWKRYAALSQQLLARYEAEQRAATPSRPHTAWLYGSLARSVRGDGEAPARPRSEWEYTLVAAQASVAGQVEPWCGGLAGALAPGTAPAGRNPVRLKAALTGCSSSAKDEAATGYDVKQEMGLVAVPRTVCNEVPTQVLVTRLQTVCNQYGANCYSYTVGEWVTETKPVCSEVTDMVEQLREVQVPYDAVRPGTSLHVSYTLEVELAGKSETHAESSTFSVAGQALVRAPADPAALAAARPGVHAATGSAMSGLPAAVEGQVGQRVRQRMAAERARVAAAAEAAGDAAGAREMHLLITSGPDAGARDAAWAWVAKHEGLPPDALQQLAGGQEQVAQPSVVAVGGFSYDPRSIDVKSRFAVLRYGVPPLAMRFAPQFIRFAEVPSQPERMGIVTGASGGVSPTLQLRRDGFGAGYHDELAYGVWIGGRISDAYQYPGATNPGEEEETVFAMGYLGSYTGMLGWRGATLGLFAGARAQYTGTRLGDARTAGAAFPFVGRFELRLSEALPVIAEAWAGDVFEPGGTPRSLGASLDVPLMMNVWLFARFERRHLQMQFGGLSKDDFVEAGRRQSDYMGLGATLSLQ